MLTLAEGHGSSRTEALNKRITRELRKCYMTRPPRDHGIEPPGLRINIDAPWRVQRGSCSGDLRVW
ncbi:MAG: hypothetical protein B7733_16705 [Myxococcales bacterium FL481]|nr:MAG: hypothetical protein B7733_16705 [Myxococcales bacterium FL481]